MTLTIQDLGALGELLGSVAVLATLVYLALQTRQNVTAILAQLDAARAKRQRVYPVQMPFVAMEWIGVRS
jgi:hypothetical protein